MQLEVLTRLITFLCSYRHVPIVIGLQWRICFTGHALCTHIYVTGKLDVKRDPRMSDIMRAE